MLLNKKHTRDFILKKAKTIRPGWDPTQVSPAFLQKLELKLMGTIERALHSHPSVGKTIKELI
jgi:hypothetical protein